MDWKYKHFNHAAIFKAAREGVLEAARAVVAESLEKIEETNDGFTARGYRAWHPAIATFQFSPEPNGTRVAVELLVERAAMRGYMLFDVGGYYTSLIDKWFSGIARRLGSEREEIIASKTTTGVKSQQGCLAGCLVWLLVGACLGLLAILLDRALFPQFHGSMQGPFGAVAAIIGLLAGVVAFLYVASPDAPVSKFIRERLQRSAGKEKK